MQQQMAYWLEELGMSEYARTFDENDIDFSVLRDLTDKHLKDLGVSLGHRLKMLRAIGELANTAAALPPAQSIQGHAPAQFALGGQETEIARLRRELSEALEQQGSTW